MRTLDLKLFSWSQIRIMAMDAENKAIRKELHTFLTRGKEGIIGYKTENDDGKTYVIQIWCKLCAKYKGQLLGHPQVRGAAKRSIKAFTEGTNVVTKHQVFLLLNNNV